jgi:hypothetical protein
MTPMISPRGGKHPICGPFAYIRDTREGRHIERCKTCGAVRISGRTADEARRNGG